MATSTATITKDLSTIHLDGQKKDNIIRVSKEEYEASNYPDWLPTWDPADKQGAETKDFNKAFVDRGHFADKDLKNLLGSSDSVQIKNLSPKLGSEVHGIQLSQLTNAGRDDLALFVAQRGVVVFRDQDLKDQGLQFNKEFGEYFGPLQIHQASGAPEGYSQFHIVYQKRHTSDPFAKHLSLRGWHTDTSVVQYPPGTTFFAHLDGPVSGGDTVFTDTQEAYERLSPKFQEILSGLKGIHTFKRTTSKSKEDGGIERWSSPPVAHPIVRIHPVTKKKSIYINVFIDEIEGLKKEESEAILGLLFNHINHSHDLQVRASYEPGTVVVWDNRRVAHASTLDWNSVEDEAPRHLYRITPAAERPVGSEEELEEWNR